MGLFASWIGKRAPDGRCPDCGAALKGCFVAGVHCGRCLRKGLAVRRPSLVRRMTAALKSIGERFDRPMGPCPCGGTMRERLDWIGLYLECDRCRRRERED